MLSNETMAVICHTLYNKIHTLDTLVKSSQTSKEIGELIGPKVCENFDVDQYQAHANKRFEEALDGYNKLISAKEDMIKNLPGYERVSLVVDKTHEIFVAYEKEKPYTPEEKELLFQLHGLIKDNKDFLTSETIGLRVDDEHIAEYLKSYEKHNSKPA